VTADEIPDEMINEDRCCKWNERDQQNERLGGHRRFHSDKSENDRQDHLN